MAYEEHQHPPPRKIPPGAPLERIEIPPEEALKRGVIHTRVSRPVALALAGAFLLIAYGVPLLQLAIDARHGRRTHVAELFERVPSRANLRAWEEGLERASGAKGFFQPVLQGWVSGYGGFGNTLAVLGRNGWLFYRPGVDYVTGPGFLDPSRLEQRRKAMIEEGT